MRELPEAPLASIEAQLVAVVDYQHPKHQFGINRRPPNIAIVRFKPLVNICERRCHKSIDAPQQVVLRNALIEPKLIEQTPLLVPSPTIAASKTVPRGSPESLFGSVPNPFFGSIGQERHFQPRPTTSV
jgi:hypothetical protein